MLLLPLGEVAGALDFHERHERLNLARQIRYESSDVVQFADWTLQLLLIPWRCYYHDGILALVTYLDPTLMHHETQELPCRDTERTLLRVHL